MTFGVLIADHDFDIKARRIKEFLEDRAAVSINFEWKNRAGRNYSRAGELMVKLVNILAPIANLTRDITRVHNGVAISLGPGKSETIQLSTAMLEQFNREDEDEDRIKGIELQETLMIFQKSWKLEDYHLAVPKLLCFKNANLELKQK
jgi:hypothetical protein